MDNFKFKRSFFGEQVLLKRVRFPLTYPGDFGSKWVKANQDDVVQFYTEIKMLKEKVSIVKRMLKEHPDYFI